MKFSHPVLNVVFSCLFFAIFSWVCITLLASRFSDTFSYIFFIFIRDGGLFDMLGVFFLVVGAISCLAFLIISSWLERYSMLLQPMSIVFIIIFVYSIMLLMSLHRPINTMELANLLLIESSIDHRNLFEIMLDYKFRIATSFFAYFAFIFLPLFFALSGFMLNKKNKIAVVLENARPSFNVIVMALFACGFQPFGFKENFYQYLDSGLYFFALMLFFIVILRGRYTLDFYKITNILLIIVGLLVTCICSKLIASYDQYFNVRYTLYIFVFVLWWIECMVLGVVKNGE